MTTETQGIGTGRIQGLRLFGVSGLAPLADSDWFGGSPANGAKVRAGARRGVAANRRADVFLVL
jgi:hypothetical protein